MCVCVERERGVWCGWGRERDRVVCEKREKRESGVCVWRVRCVFVCVCGVVVCVCVCV